MDQISEKKLAASLRSDIPQIDIHGIVDSHTVEQKIDNLLFSTVKHDSMCRIIHGIGSAVQGDRVHAYLKTHPMVHAYFLSEDGGSTIALF